MKKIITLILIYFSPITLSAEADNFFAIHLPLISRTLEINALAEKHLISAIQEANQDSSCNEETLYKNLRKRFANHTRGQFVMDLISNHSELSSTVALKHSIYHNWQYSDGIALSLKAKKKGDLALSPLVQINDQIIGIDKLEHMFGMGYHYFKHYYQESRSLSQVLSVGAGFEKYILGGSFVATGIFSYGDLAANFNGMRFWNNMLGKNSDILGQQYDIAPYLLCVNQKWIINPESPIDFSHYVDESMNESINCSKFARQKAAHKIAYNIKELQKITHAKYCQENIEILETLKAKYKIMNINKYILNFDGIRKFSFKKDIK